MTNKLINILGILSRGFLLAVVVLFFLACSSDPKIPKNYIHPELQVYVQVFKERCELYKADCSKLKSVSMTIAKLPFFLNLSGRTAAYCVHLENQIVVRKDWWENSTYSDKELLITHELGHCILGKDHIEEKVGVRIMNPVILDTYDYFKMYQMLYNDFFNCSKDCPIVQYDRGRYSREYLGVKYDKRISTTKSVWSPERFTNWTKNQ